MPLCGSVTHIYFFYSWFRRLSIAPMNKTMRQVICTPRLAYSRATIYLGMVGCVFFPHLRTWSGVSLRTAFLPGHSLGVVTTQVQMHRSPPQHVSSDSCTSGHNHPFQFCAIQMPAAMHCGHCFNTSTAWLCLSHQAEKWWKLEKCPLFVKQCSSAKKKSPAWWAQCIQNTLICTYSAYEQEICHGRATELCVLVMHWSTGGLMTPGFVRFILVCIHASKC